MKICILGAGALGVTSAYELARNGHEVTVVDRQPEPGRECSFANGGQLSYAHAEPWANPNVFPKLLKWAFQEDAPLVLRPSLDPYMIRWMMQFLVNCMPSRARRHSEVMLRLGLYSKQKMNALMADTKVDFHQLSKGILHVYSNQGSFDSARRQADFQHTLGCEEIVLSRDETFALEPTLKDAEQNILGGIHAPIDESGDIHAFTKALAKHCEEKYNVKFQFNTPIRRIHQSNGAISHVELQTEGSSYLSGFDAYVMAMGAHSSVYLRQVGLYVPIYPMKGYSISFNSSEFCPTTSITDDAAKQVYTLLGGRMRVAGTAEFARYNDSVRKARIAPLVKGMKSLFPKAPLDELTEWACLRPSTPDGPPVIGKTPIKNLFINSGHGTLGWTQAAGSARLLADVVDNKPTEIPLSGLEINRWLIKI